MDPATVPLTGDRWTPFVHTIEYQGANLTGAAFLMHVRLTYDATGSPLVVAGVTLTYGGTATVDEHLTAGRITEAPDGMAGTDSLPLSIIDISIPEATMETLPFPGERGDDSTLYYDMHITPSGGSKQVWFRGPFIVRAGSTQ